MGMFDSVGLECNLPENIEPYRKGWWQTKSLGRHMDQYYIDNDHIYKELCHYEDVPEQERTFYGEPEWDKDDFYKLIGSQKRIVDKTVVVDYTGEIECHAYVEEKQLMVRLLFTFVNGNLLKKEVLTP